MLLNVLKLKASSQALTKDDIWMTSAFKWYKNRPKDATLITCVGQRFIRVPSFAKNQTAKNKIRLNNLGYIEIFFPSKLQLFSTRYPTEAKKVWNNRNLWNGCRCVGKCPKFYWKWWCLKRMPVVIFALNKSLSN